MVSTPKRAASTERALAVAPVAQRFRDENRERVEAIVPRREITSLTAAFQAAFQ